MSWNLSNMEGGKKETVFEDLLYECLDYRNQTFKAQEDSQGTYLDSKKIGMK